MLRSVTVIKLTTIQLATLSAAIQELENSAYKTPLCSGQERNIEIQLSPSESARIVLIEPPIREVPRAGA